MSYWVIKHEIVDTFVSIHWDSPGRRWRAFDAETVLRFGSKDAALVVADTMFPGAIVLEVIESTPQALEAWVKRSGVEDEYLQPHGGAGILGRMVEEQLA